MISLSSWKKHVFARKKTKTEFITKPKNVINLDKELPIFSAISNVALDNLNLSMATNIKDYLKCFF